MSRIVLVASQARDVRARRLGRYLASRGHDVVHVAGWRDLGAPTVLRRTEPLDGLETYVHHEALGTHLQAAVTELGAELVWCHALDALWRYTAACTYTPEVERERLSGRSIYDTSWRPRRGPMPLVYDAHEYERDRPWRWSRQRTREDWAAQEERAAAVATRVVTVGEDLAYRTRVPSGHVDVITNAPPALSRPLRTAEARAALPPGRLIAFSGYPTPDRDLETLVRALPLVQQVVPDARVVLFGAPKDRAIVEMVERAGGLVFGEVPYPWPEEEDLHLLDYLSACDVGFSGAWTEFLTWRLSAPNKLYEYATAGLRQVSAEITTFDALNAQAMGALGRTYDGSVLSLAEALVAELEYPARVPAEWGERHAYERANGATIDRVVEVVPGHQSACFASERQEKRGLK